MFLPISVLTAYNTVTDSGGTTLSISTGSYVTDGGIFESYTVNTDNIQFVVSSGSAFGIKSTDRHTLTLTGNNCEIVKNQCLSDYSYIKISCGQNVEEHTITFTPSATICSSTSGAGASSLGSGSSGGGGAGPGATTPVKKKTEATKIEVSDKITTPSKSACDLPTKQAYKHEGSRAVYYVTDNCTKRAFKNPNIFFTYFKSWSDVKTVDQSKITKTPDDELSFMPWGPNFDPKYGALVKITSDPKVYLLLGTEKYWITSEEVFNNLNYKWNWIEDIDPALLDKYTIGSEIKDTNKHPNFTLIKYDGDPKVYRLEDGKKRHIKNETAFNKLKYRWDRIVSVSKTEIYPDGKEME